MNDPVSSLRPLLAVALTGTSEMPSPSTREAHQIDMLADVIRGYELGDYDRSEVIAIFRSQEVPNFDIDLWIQSKEAEGVYLSEPTIT